MRRVPHEPPPLTERRRRAGSRRLWRERRAARPLGSPFVRFRIAAVAAAQFFDLGTFGRMIHRGGIEAELNPLVARGFDAFGFPLVIVAKLALVVLIGAIVVVLATGPRPRPILASFVTVLAVAAGLVGGLSNLG
jgi:hypothetical protein